jgi:uncharacterized protein (TIGR03083 family)
MQTLAMLDVTPVLRPERAAFLALLESLSAEQWAMSTECPSYSVKGVATHILGDDLSLLSRQRDADVPGLFLIAAEMPGADLRTLLDTFNDRWVATAAFLSTEMVVDLLQHSGDLTADFYESVDLEAPCEPVGFFGSTGEPSPYWQAIAREFVERWVHHSQVRRAVGLPSLADDTFVRTGVDVVAAAAGVEGGFDDGWTLGPLRLGGTQQAADILTRAHTADEIRALVSGPAEAVDRLTAGMGR